MWLQLIFFMVLFSLCIIFTTFLSIKFQTLAAQNKANDVIEVISGKIEEVKYLKIKGLSQ